MRPRIQPLIRINARIGTVLKELQKRVLENLFEEGETVKLADDLCCGADTIS